MYTMSTYKLGNIPAMLLIVYVVISTLFLVMSARGLEETVHIKRDTAAVKDGQSVTDNKKGSLESGLNNKEPQATTASGRVEQHVNCSDPKYANGTECSLASDNGDNTYVMLIIKQMSENRGMLMRTLYVTLAVTGLVVAYFIVRSVWLRRKRTKSRKYGVVAQHGDHRDMEMKPLGDGNDDDDDDYTIFELNGRKK